METFDLQVARVAFALYVLLLAVAAVTDIRGFKIPNSFGVDATYFEPSAGFFHTLTP